MISQKTIRTFGWLALACGLMLLACGCFAPKAFAAAAAWNPPTSPMSTTFSQDGQTYRYLSGTHTQNDEDPLEYFGVNSMVSYYGRYRNINTTDSSEALYYTLSPNMGIFGSDVNKNPDPYMWNLFYNYYVEANGMSAENKVTEAAFNADGVFKVIEDAGTSAALQFRPDLVYTYNDRDLASTMEGVAAINEFTNDSEYYKGPSDLYMGDENYDPLIAYREGEGFDLVVQSVHHIAQAVKTALSINSDDYGVNVATRYGEDPVEMGVKYEEFTRALNYYILSKIDDGTTPLKKVYFVFSIYDDGTVYCLDPRDPMTVLTWADMCQSGTISVINNPVEGTYPTGSSMTPSEATSLVIPLDELSTADALVIYEPDNAGVGTAWSRYDDGSAEKASQLRNVFSNFGYSDAATNMPIFTTIGNLPSGFTRGGVGVCQVYQWVNAFIYPELMNAVELTAYYYDTFYHVKPESLSSVVTYQLSDTLSLAKGVSMSDVNNYSADKIEAMFDEGLDYYFANKAKIDAEHPELKATNTLVNWYYAHNKGLLRLAGNNRYQTMSAIATNGFANADTVVIASGTKFADALSSAGLAGSLRSPILLTKPDALSEDAANEITALGARNVIIVGGEAAVSDAVKQSLEGMGLSVTRIAGANRQATAREIASRLTSNVAIVATGNAFADALSVSPYAYNSSLPIYLTSKGALDSASLDAIKAAGYSRVYIVGGESAVSAAAQAQIEACGADVIRLAGANRYQTSNEIAKYLIANGLATIDGVALATGVNFPDALSGAALCGSNRSVLVLASDSNTTTIDDVVASNAGSIRSLYVFGGTGAVSESLAAKFAVAAGA